MSYTTSLRRWAGAAGACALLAAPLALTACGSSSDDETTTATKAATTGDAAAYVSKAREISAAAQSGFVSGPSNEFTPAEKLKPVTGWFGPTSAPAPPTGKSLVIISCGVPACDAAAEATVANAQSLGIKGRVVNRAGKTDQQTYVAAFDSAIALKPDVIIGISVSPAQVADGLDRARKAGILTVSIADPTATGGPGQYAAAADASDGLSAELLGWSIVADTDGKANAIVVKDQTFPAAIRKIDNLIKVLDDCSGCTTKVVNWQVPDASDPSKASNILTGAINGNPKADVLVLPYTVGEASAIQAVEASGRKIAIYLDSPDKATLASLKSGQLARVSGGDGLLLSYQALDQVVRGLAGKPFVTAPKIGHVFSPRDAPESPVGYGVKYVDYAKEYQRIWSAGKGRR